MAYQKPVKDALKEIDGFRDRVLGMVDHCAVAMEVLDSLQQAGAEAVTVSLGYHFGQVQGVLLTLTNPTHEQAISGIRMLRKRGYKVTEIEDYAELGRRSYLMGEIRFQLMFYSWREGMTCKYVKTGTEEKDVFELRCDDGTLPGIEIEEAA